MYNKRIPKNSKYPFIIKADPLLEDTAYPTHTHGLTEIATLIGDLLPYVTHSIWIGKMNHLGRFENGTDMVLKQATNRIRQGQMDIIIKQIYERYKTNPLIRWKKEIKKVVGIPVSKINGLDI